LLYLIFFFFVFFLFFFVLFFFFICCVLFCFRRLPPLAVDSAVMNPVSYVIALRAKNNLQIFNLEMKNKMKSKSIGHTVGPRTHLMPLHTLQSFLSAEASIAANVCRVTYRPILG
jgi:hypothetical protein